MSTKTYPKWRKIILLPCWGIQLFFELMNILFLGLAIAWVNRHYDDDHFSDSDKKVRISASINLTVMILCVGLTSAEIVLFLFKRLEPLPFVLMNAVKTGIWTILWLVSLVLAILNRNGRYGTGGSVVSSFLLLGFWIPLIYSLQEYRQQKTRANLEGGMSLESTYTTSQPYNKESQPPMPDGNMPEGNARPQMQNYYAPPPAAAAGNFGVPGTGAGIVGGAAMGATGPGNQSYYEAPPENYGVAGNAYRGVDTEESVPLTRTAVVGPRLGMLRMGGTKGMR